MTSRLDVLGLCGHRKPRAPGQPGTGEFGRALLTWALFAVIAIAFAASTTMLVLGW